LGGTSLGSGHVLWKWHFYFLYHWLRPQRLYGKNGIHDNGFFFLSM